MGVWLSGFRGLGFDGFCGRVNVLGEVDCGIWCKTQVSSSRWIQCKIEVARMPSNSAPQRVHIYYPSGTRSQKTIPIMVLGPSSIIGAYMDPLGTKLDILNHQALFMVKSVHGS